jgi:hypothetical protein
MSCKDTKGNEKVIARSEIHTVIARLKKSAEAISKKKEIASLRSQ